MRDFQNYMSRAIHETEEEAPETPGSPPRPLTDKGFERATDRIASNEDPGKVIQQFVDAHAGEFARLQQRVTGLLKELEGSMAGMPAFQSQAPDWAAQYSPSSAPDPVSLPSTSSKLQSLRQAWWERQRRRTPPPTV